MVYKCYLLAHEGRGTTTLSLVSVQTILRLVRGCTFLKGNIWLQWEIVVQHFTNLINIERRKLLSSY